MLHEYQELIVPGWTNSMLYRLPHFFNWVIWNYHLVPFELRDAILENIFWELPSYKAGRDLRLLGYKARMACRHIPSATTLDQYKTALQFAIDLGIFHQHRRLAYSHLTFANICALQFRIPTVEQQRHTIVHLFANVFPFMRIKCLQIDCGDIVGLIWNVLDKWVVPLGPHLVNLQVFYDCNIPVTPIQVSAL